ncbi:hypothetical protein BG60_33680 [Caballeronia zhejiangensis]|uniref:Uncharacterized protein n=1 Tax=Caballeronia zhejiangensis TaxID=871203 RepID=A0A656Q928_9BURK|nr:hypothetical protein BG60_33680 [Caballeronia zhejiangensis]
MEEALQRRSRTIDNASYLEVRNLRSFSGRQHTCNGATTENRTGMTAMNARFDLITVDCYVCVIDRDEAGCRSVKNDIERIVAEDVTALLTPERRLVYRDSQGDWGEVLLTYRDGTPHFGGFCPLSPESDLRKALDMLTPAFVGAPSDDDLLTMGYRRPFKLLDDGRIAAILTHHDSQHALAAGIHAFGHDDAYYFETYESAASALKQWNGVGDPEGWFLHPRSGRRPEDDDPANEIL